MKEDIKHLRWTLQKRGFSEKEIDNRINEVRKAIKRDSDFNKNIDFNKKKIKLKVNSR